MTVSVTENKIDAPLSQDKIDINMEQQKVDTHLTQNKTAETKQDESAPEDPNWRAFREARKKDRAEKEAAEKRAAEKEAEAIALKAAMEAAFAKTSPHYPAQEDNGQEETEEQRIKRLVQTEIATREAQAEQHRVKREQQEYPTRLVQTYPDFHHVTTQDNLDYLDYHFPEVSRPLQRLGEGFDKWSDIYQAIKKFVPNNSTAKKDAARAESNFNKPKSMSGTQITQPGEARSNSSMQDIEARRASRYQEMQRIIKGVGN